MPPTDFGKLIFEWRDGKAMPIVLVIVALLVVAGTIATGEPLAVAGGLVIATGLGLAVASSVVGTLRCYERGLVKKTLFGERSLAYAHVERLTYQVTRVVGVYAQTNMRVALVAAKPHRGLSLFGVYREGVEAFRDAVSATIAEKMAAELAARSEVVWTENVRLTREGIRFEVPKFIGKKEVFVPFGGPPDVQFQQGVMYLKMGGVPMSLGTATPNFYPGYRVMLWLAQQAAARA